jgi:hypothetical protein
LLFFNPYLLDFFSLCRGYGLGLAFSAASLFFWNKVLQTGDHKPVQWALLAGILATYANYSFFAFFFATSCAGFLLYLTAVRFRLRWRTLFDLAGGFLLLLPALWHVGELLKRNELYFGGDRGLLKDTVQMLAAKCLYEIPVDSDGTGMQVFSGFLVAALLGGAVVFLVKKGSGSLFRFIILGFLLSLLFPVFLFHVFQVKYPMERFAIYYLPLVGLYFPVFFQEVLDGFLKKWQSWAFAVCLAGLAVVPFVRGANFTYTNNWKYDANTEKMLETLAQEPHDGKISLGVNPLFEPAVNYYRETKSYDWLEKVTRESIETDRFDYVYCRLDELGKLPGALPVATFSETNTCLARVVKKD